MTYTTPPTAEPFTLAIPDSDLTSMRRLLELSPVGPRTFENTQTERNFGVTHDWLSSTKSYWLDSYAWRTHEKHINSFPNYKMQIEGIGIHFIGLFSDKADAVPIIFMHGWPGSFVEFLPLLGLVKEKWARKECPYHIIVPSLPGYTLSGGGPTDRDWEIKDTARVMNQLMVNLGFNKYIAQGGDVGSLTGTIMAAFYDECVGVHLNMFSTREQPKMSTLTEMEKGAVEHGMKWRETGTSYALEHGNRPSTIGHVLSSSPLALLAWIGEKFLEWSDETPSLDAILTNISLYWFMNGFPRSIYPYRTIMVGPRAPPPHIPKPTGFSFFPFELIPGIKSVIEKQCNLVFYKQHGRGGHFAALEKPQELWTDVEEFVAKAWKG